MLSSSVPPMRFRGTSTPYLSFPDGYGYRNQYDDGLRENPSRFMDTTLREPMAPPRRRKNGRSLSQSHLASPQVSRATGLMPKEYDRDAFAFNYFNNLSNSTLKRHASSDMSYARSVTPQGSLPMSPIPMYPIPVAPLAPTSFPITTSPLPRGPMLMPMTMSPPPYVEDETEVKKVWPPNDEFRGSRRSVVGQQHFLDPGRLLMERQRAAEKYYQLKEKVDEKYFNRSASVEAMFPLLTASPSKEQLYQQLAQQQQQIEGLQQQQQFIEEILLSNPAVSLGSTPSPSGQRHQHHHHQQQQHRHRHASRGATPDVARRSSSREKIHQQIQKQQEQVANHIKQLQEQLAMLRERRASKEAANKRDARGNLIENENPLKPIDISQANEMQSTHETLNQKDNMQHHAREQPSVEEMSQNRRGLSSPRRPSNYSGITTQSSVEYDTKSSQIDSESAEERYLSEDDNCSIPQRSEEEPGEFRERHGLFRPLRTSDDEDADLMPYVNDDEEFLQELQIEVEEEDERYSEFENARFEQEAQRLEEERQNHLMEVQRQKQQQQQQQEQQQREEDLKRQEVEEKRRRQQEDMMKAEQEMLRQQQLFIEQQQRLIEQQKQLEEQRKALEAQQLDHAVQQKVLTEREPALSGLPTGSVPNPVQKPPRRSLSGKTTPRPSSPFGVPSELRPQETYINLDLAAQQFVNEASMQSKDKSVRRKRHGSIKARAPDPPITPSQPELYSRTCHLPDSPAARMQKPMESNHSFVSSKQEQPTVQQTQITAPGQSHSRPVEIRSEFGQGKYNAVAAQVFHDKDGSSQLAQRTPQNTQQYAQLVANQIVKPKRKHSRAQATGGAVVEQNEAHNTLNVAQEAVFGKQRPPKPARRKLSSASTFGSNENFLATDRTLAAGTFSSPTTTPEVHAMETLTPVAPPRHKSPSPQPPVGQVRKGKLHSADPFMDHFDHYFSPKALLKKKFPSQPNVKSSKENLASVPTPAPPAPTTVTAPVSTLVSQNPLPAAAEKKASPSAQKLAEVPIESEVKQTTNEAVQPEVEASLDAAAKEEIAQVTRRQTLPDVIAIKDLEPERPANPPMVEKPRLVRKKSLPSNTSAAQPCPPPGWERERVSALAHEAREARYREAQEGRKISWSAIKEWILNRQLIIIVACVNLYIAYYFLTLFQRISNENVEKP